jgi:Protein of unknown function (DUF1326)
MATSANDKIPNWKRSGGWFDVCNCNIPCPCEFAQAPTDGNCAGVLVWHNPKRTIQLEVGPKNRTFERAGAQNY